MVKNSGFPLPPAFEDVDDYLHNLIELYLDSLVQKLAGEVQILNFFLGDRDLLEETVPADWMPFFDECDLDQILDFLIFFRKPESELASYVRISV